MVFCSLSLVPYKDIANRCSDDQYSMHNGGLIRVACKWSVCREGLNILFYFIEYMHASVYLRKVGISWLMCLTPGQYNTKIIDDINFDESVIICIQSKYCH